MQYVLTRWLDFRRALGVSIVSLCVVSVCVADRAPPPTAIELGIMQGRPVPQEHRVSLANWMDPPFNRWSLQHVPQILPTATVYRGDGPVAELSSNILDLASLEVTSASGETLSIAQWLSASYTDGFIVVRNGEIVYEAYLNGMHPETRHLSYSISKSVIGILAGILIDSGELDPDLKVEDYVPELQRSGFAGSSVRDVLDMRVGIDWSEAYADSNSPWRRWKDAIGWTPWRGEVSDVAPEIDVGNYGFLPTLRGDSQWPGGFKYVSPTAEVAGWVLERASGMPLAEILSKRLWAPLGAEQDAYMTTDRSFAPAAAGGFGATLRDLARFGQMVLNEGAFNGRQIVSKEWIADLRFAGSNSAWRNGQYRGYWNPDGAYRSFWYVAGDTGGSFEALGIYGQRLYVNPAQNLVVVRLSSGPEAVSRDDYDLSSRVLAAIRSSLQK